MVVDVDISPDVLIWTAGVGLAEDELHHKFPKFDSWVQRKTKPTLKQITAFAKAAGVPLGYMFMEEPPLWSLPIPDFREGFDKGGNTPSADLMAVLNLALSRQDWYREYADRNGYEELEIVGSARRMSAMDTAASIRKTLLFEVKDRKGNWDDSKKYLLRSFEDLGGLTILTSMVGNNTKRPLDPNEFRGFALPDPVAPLIFINSNQTLNGQIFTIVHEIAHIWRGQGGIGDERIDGDPQAEIERWCNHVASEVLVPRDDLRRRWPKVSEKTFPDALDDLARVYRCGTLVVLQALRRHAIVEFPDFASTYRQEETRLAKLASGSTPGGDFYHNQPYRIGTRLSRALASDVIEGRTPYSEALQLMSMRSAMVFDKYVERLGVGL